MQCFQEDGRPPIYEPVEIDVNSNHLYEMKCPKGHLTYTCLQNFPFELLFEIGVHALNNGFPDAACTRFYVALERFHEFCIECLYLNQGGEKSTFDDFWKNISAQSERQLGAFFVLYAIYKKGNANFPDPLNSNNDFVKKRNKIIHKGYLPSESEAYLVGEKIYNFIIEVLKIFKTEMPTVISDVTFRHLKKARENKSVSNNVSTMSMGFCLSVAKGEDYKSFADALEAVKSNKYGLSSV